MKDLNLTACHALEQAINNAIAFLETDYKKYADIAAKDEKSVLRDVYFVKQRNDMLAAAKQLRAYKAVVVYRQWRLIKAENKK